MGVQNRQAQASCQASCQTSHSYHSGMLDNTHSLLRLSSPAKAPLVSSIVPEISLWSRSLGKRQTVSSTSTLTHTEETTSHPGFYLHVYPISPVSHAVMRNGALGRILLCKLFSVAWISQSANKIDSHLKQPSSHVLLPSSSHRAPEKRNTTESTGTPFYLLPSWNHVWPCLLSPHSTFLLQTWL